MLLADCMQYTVMMYLPSSLYGHLYGMPVPVRNLNSGEALKERGRVE